MDRVVMCSGQGGDVFWTGWWGVLDRVVGFWTGW